MKDSWKVLTLNDRLKAKGKNAIESEARLARARVGPRGVKTIPACNAAWSGLLHIIDFRHASFILRLVFAVCTTGNSKQCIETLSFR